MNYSKKDIQSIIKTQALIRGYLQRKRVLIPRGSYHTKEWRISQSWYKGGKCTECEKHQLSLIKKIMNIKNVSKTDLRLNIETHKLEILKNPMVNDNGFDYTENFDYIIEFDKYTILFNLKFLCDSGGAQTRSLREVYNFIKAQYKFLQENEDTKYIFINILDGDCSNKHMNKFLYLSKSYKKYNSKCFTGDMYQFQELFLSGQSILSNR